MTKLGPIPLLPRKISVGVCYIERSRGAKERARNNLADQGHSTLCWIQYLVQGSHSLTLHPLGVNLGASPACKHESDLVEEICDVVDHIEGGLRDGSHQVTEQVAKRVDG